MMHPRPAQIAGDYKKLSPCHNDSYSPRPHCVHRRYNGHLLTPSIFIEYVNFTEENFFLLRRRIEERGKFSEIRLNIFNKSQHGCLEEVDFCVWAASSKPRNYSGRVQKFVIL
jgi:hypothetical protein